MTFVNVVKGYLTAWCSCKKNYFRKMLIRHKFYLITHLLTTGERKWVPNLGAQRWAVRQCIGCLPFQASRACLRSRAYVSHCSIQKRCGKPGRKSCTLFEKHWVFEDSQKFYVFEEKSKPSSNFFESSKTPWGSNFWPIWMQKLPKKRY